MVRLPVHILAAALCLAVAALPGLPGAASAQTAAPRAPAANPDEAPPEVLASLLTAGSGATIVDRFLRGDGAAAPVVARRAAAIIRQLGAMRTKLKPNELLAAVDRVVHVAARSLSYASVMRMAVASDYRPENAVVAWDFGPRPGNFMPGFERILPDDRRLAGDGLAGRLQGGQGSLLKDGISGVRRIEVDLADGDYRIILMTRNAGDPALGRTPFGREVRINGMTLLVNGEGPDSWLDHALLARSSVREAGGGYDRAGGFLTGEVDAEAGALYQTQQGGAIVLEGAARNGKMVIELANFGDAESYLTGLVIEPPDKVSDLMLSRAALDSFIPLDARIALETEIMVVAAKTVQGIAPAAGQAFESDTVVTAN